MSPRIGSLCSGYGGLDMAVSALLGGELAWWSDIDDGAVRIMSHHHPGVPNLGDFTALDWADVAPVDVLTAGYPCQPFSHAGARKGTDDERHLWPYIREAIRHLRPRLTVLENVAGHRSLGFDRVLGDMAEDGLHVRWTSIRASDVDACHKRERVFLGVAADPACLSWSQWHRDPGTAAITTDLGHQWAGRARDGWPGSAHGDLLPTPRASDGEKGGPGQRGSSGDLMLPSAVALLPTPTATAYGSNQSDSDGAAVRPSLDTLARELVDWGRYEPAIRRHEAAFGRSVPMPVQPSGKGTPQLAPVFSEWMMGLPAGHVTDPAIWEGMLNAKGKPATKAAIRSAQLRALGNGVVPLQAYVGVGWLLDLGADAA